MPRLPTPPPLPSEILTRVIRVAGLDGRIVLWSSGVFALLSAAGHSALGAIIGLAAAGTGAIEVHGASMLAHTDARGINWTIRAQLLLLLTILFYCGACILNFDPALFRDQPQFKTFITQNSLSVDQGVQLLRDAWVIGYVLVAVVSVIYQGGMAIYYARNRRVILQAMDEIGAT
jgi:hypothetical protein